MTRLLSQQRLAAIARRWDANMPETCTVLPRTEFRLPGAVDEVTYPDPAKDDLSGLTSFGCRWKPATASTEGVADQAQAAVRGVLQLPVGSRIVPTDRLYVAGQDASGTAWAIMLEPHAPLGPRTWEAVREIPCIQVPYPVES